MNIERRFITTEFRVARQDGKPTKLRGYGSVFNSWSEDLGGFREMIAPGAFTAVLSVNPDTRCLINHDPNLILGRTVSGTLTLRQDNTGLHYEVQVPDTSAGRDILVSAERGDITQSSFGFTVAEDDDAEEWYDDQERRTDRYFGTKRIIRKVGQLYDVSPVTYPAYTASSVQARDQGRTGTLEHIRLQSLQRVLREKSRIEAEQNLAQHRIAFTRQLLFN